MYILMLRKELQSILFVADLLHPVHDLAVEFFLDGDVRHRGRRRGPVPVLLAGREPDHVAGVDFLDHDSATVVERLRDQAATINRDLPVLLRTLQTGVPQFAAKVAARLGITSGIAHR